MSERDQETEPESTDERIARLWECVGHQAKVQADRYREVCQRLDRLERANRERQPTTSWTYAEPKIGRPEQ